MRQSAATRFDVPYRDPAPTPAEAWPVAWPHLAALQQDPAHREQMAVLAVDPAGTVRHTLLASDRFLVVGRHSRCALRLPDPAVSLRHLVAHWTRSAARPTIRLWDLRTGRPFVTEDAVPTASVVADGALFAQLGSHLLMFVPLGAPAATNAACAWATLPERRFATARVARHRVEASDTTVTHTLPPFVFGSEPGAALAATGRVVLEMPDGRTERWVSEEQLDRGLLFGRYDRGPLAAEGDDGLSRVHLLVVRIDDRIWAVDTASTNGTRHNGVAVSASLLGSQASLLLAKRCIVRWAEAGAQS